MNFKFTWKSLTSPSGGQVRALYCGSILLGYLSTIFVQPQNQPQLVYSQYLDSFTEAGLIPTPQSLKNRQSAAAQKEKGPITSFEVEDAARSFLNNLELE